MGAAARLPESHGLRLLPRLADHVPEGAECLEYEPRGAAREIWLRREPEILLDGPAGTGKTRAWTQYALHLAEAYPGCRILFIRRTRASMSETVLATWEDKVLSPVDHPMLKGPRRAYRDEYEHPNGTKIILASFENIERLFSMEIDAAFIDEAIEITESMMMSLKRALRNGRMPWQPIIMSTNPGPWMHWLNQRCSDINPKGRLTRLRSSFRDNPTLTTSYLRELDLGLHGSMRDRLYLGLWVGAQGLVVSTFGTHNILSADVSEGGEPDALSVRIHGAQQYLILPREAPFGTSLELDGDSYERAVRVERWVAGFDWGPKAPASAQLWAVVKVRGKFRAILTEQHYGPMRVEQYAGIAATWHRKFGLGRVVCDHDPHLINYLNDNVFRHDGRAIAVPAKKGWAMGVDVLNTAFDQDEHGIPRALVFDNALQHAPDDRLTEEKRPYDLVSELQALSWGEVKAGQADHERTDGAPDHAVDTARYVLVDLFGKDSPLEEPGAARRYAPGTMGAMFKHSERRIVVPTTPTPTWREDDWDDDLEDDDWVAA